MANNSDIILTDEQKIIISSKLGKSECIIVNAYAGTGKTTTLREFSAHRQDKKILYICFNRETALQAKKKFTKNTDCKTIHSLAYNQIGGAYRNKLGQPRPLEVMRWLRISEPYLAVLVLETLSRFHHSIDSKIERHHLPPNFNESHLSRNNILNYARELWSLMLDKESQVLMPHDGYLKIWALSTPKLVAYDIILLDEAQDTNPVVLDVLKNQLKTGKTSLIFVGDTHQGIYRWRHAIDAMEQIESMAIERFPLTTSFRFGSEIAEYASLLLNHWKDDPVRLKGAGPSSTTKTSSVLIARTNAEIISQAIESSQRGQLLHFAGTKAKENWDPYLPYGLQIPLDLLSLKNGKKDSIITPHIRAFSNFNEAQRHAHGLDGRSGADVELAKHLGLVENYGDALPELLAQVRKKSCSPIDAVISYSTAHRSKGLEWTKVKLLDDFQELASIPIVSKTEFKKDPAFREEINLLYVAMTRGSESLVYNRDLNEWLRSQKSDNFNNVNIKTIIDSTPMNNAEWVIIDTETDGLSDPIHVVEIAAQRMNGWEPVGEKFRILINHRVPIPLEASAVHGYTEEYLEKNGVDPLVAHTLFREYAGGLPLVAHNLSFDWNRSLFNEWLRLGLEPVGQRGFCSLMLSRRLVDECKSYRLDSLRSAFQVSSDNAHRAFGDVETLVQLFERIFKPRLEAAGLKTFESIAEFSKKTPVAKCLAYVKSNSTKPSRVEKVVPIDAWYYLDSHSNTHGPITAKEIHQLTGGTACWVWQEGMSDWISSMECPIFLNSIQNTSQFQKTASLETKGNLSELLALCRGLSADGKITTNEVVFLSKWLEDAGVISDWPATEIAETVERITADGRVTMDEKAELLNLIQSVC